MTPHLLVWVLGACVCLLLLALVGVVLRGRRVLHTRLEEVHSQLDEMRTHDPLTGLLTRPEFEVALDRAVVASDRRALPLALFYVGLDNFRQLNEGYGHKAGDGVLVRAAQRLAKCNPRPLALSRLGGDEFAVLMAAGLDQVGSVAEGLLVALQRPYKVEDLDLQLSASVGVAVYPDHGARPRLLGQAALAMRSVKQMGGGGHAVYAASMAVDQREQAELLQALRHAVERKQLQLVYQPKIDAKSQQITGAEALLRWQHPTRGTLSPALFIPLAEKHGLIAPIGRWVIDEACRQAAQWRSLGLRIRVAVNISGHQMRQDDLVQAIEQSLHRHGVAPGRLTCEITESVAMEDTSHTRQAFEDLRRAGLDVSIDDFGTGHSSLATLRKLPAAELKIDRAFITDLAGSERARSIVLAIVQMARTLGLRVVAEGVETTAQRDALVALGCDELQGYLFAKPMNPVALALWADGDDARLASAVHFRPAPFAPTAPAPLEK